MERPAQEDWSDIPPDLRRAVEVWKEEDGSFDLSPRAWFTDGRSGEPVGRVVRKDRTSGNAEHYVLKLMSRDALPRAYNLQTAWSRSRSFQNHLAEPLREHIIADGELRGVLMAIAGGNVQNYVPLTSRCADRNFPEHCSQVVRSVVHDWNEGGSFTRSSTVGDVLNQMMSRHLDTARQWALGANDTVDGENIAVKDGEFRFRVDPFAFLAGSYATHAVPDLLIGKAHGDLSGRNILLPGHPSLDSDSYVLIDYDRFSTEAPLARDPMHLLVALALDHFDDFGRNSWQGLARALVHPGENDHSPQFEIFRRTSEAIQKRSPFPSSTGWGAEWEQQCLLFLVGAGLMHIGRDLRVDDEDAAKSWCFYLASLAAEEFLRRRISTSEQVAALMPAHKPLHRQDEGNPPTSTLIRDRTTERKNLRDRLASGVRGVAVLIGARGVGKTKLLDVVLRELAEQSVPLRIRRHEASEIAKLDTERLIEYLEDASGQQGEPSNGRSSLVRLEAALQRLGDSRTVLAIDSAENLLDPNSNVVVDRELDRALEMLATRNGHAVTVLLVSQEKPTSPRSGTTWPTAEPPVDVGSLPQDHFFAYLASLDSYGRLDPMLLPHELRGTLYEVLEGNPRLAELAHAVVASNSQVDLLTLADGLNQKHRAGSSDMLIRLLLDGLSQSQRRVLRALAAFDAPVPIDGIVKVLCDVPRYEVSNILSDLTDERIAYCANGGHVRHYFLPSSDARSIMGTITEYDQAKWHYAASAALTELKVSTPRNVNDLRLHFAELKALLLAQEYHAAHSLIVSIDSFLRKWNCRQLLLGERIKVREKLNDEHDELENLDSLAEICVSLRSFEIADKVFGNALNKVVHHLRDVRAMKLHYTFTSMYWEQGDTQMALTRYEFVRNEAQREGYPEVLALALEGIADCYRRQGNYIDAIKQAELAFEQYERLDYPVTQEARDDAALRRIAIALKLARWQGELGRHVKAESLVNLADTIQHGQPDDVFKTACLDGLADLRLDLNLVEEAESLANVAIAQAIRQYDEVSLIQARTTLSYCYLRTGRRDRAWREIDLAAQYRRPGRSLVVLALSALAAYQQEDNPTATCRFEKLYAEAKARTEKDSRDFAAHDFVGYAVCGLHLSTGRNLSEAVEAIYEARCLTPPTPVLIERLRFMLEQFDASAHLSPVLDILTYGSTR